MSDLKAIETVYNGFRFRSRLEARWAVFFDSLGIKYDYEPEGYDLDGVYYLPDFYLPELETWVEIKGSEPTSEEEAKAIALAKATGKNVVVMFGSISGQMESCGESGYMHFADYGWDNSYKFCECSDCGFIGIEFDGRTDRMKCKSGENPCPRSSHGDKGYNSDSNRLFVAYQEAKSARFEHGENGETVSYKSKRQKTREALNKAFSVDAVKPFYPMLFTLPCGHPDIDGDEDNKLDAVYTCAKEKYNFLDTLFFYHQVNQKEWLIEIDRLKALLEELREENEYVPDEETKIEIRQVLKELYKIRSTTGLTYVIEGW